MLAITTVITSCSDSNTYRIGVSQCSGGAWREKVNNEISQARADVVADYLKSIGVDIFNVEGCGAKLGDITNRVAVVEVAD